MSSREAGSKAGPKHAAAKQRASDKGTRRPRQPRGNRSSLRQMRSTIGRLEQQLAHLEERVAGLEWLP